MFQLVIKYPSLDTAKVLSLGVPPGIGPLVEKPCWGIIFWTGCGAGSLALFGAGNASLFRGYILSNLFFQSSSPSR